MKLSRELLSPLIISLASLVFSIFVLPLVSLNLFHSPRVSEFGIFEAWNIWDGPHYLDIASNWYASTGEKSNWIVFLPLYPSLVKAVNFITGLGILYSAFLVSAAASIGSAVTFYKLLLLDETNKTSFRSTFLLFIFPTSFFLFLPYPESVFLFLILQTLLNLRKGNFLQAGIFAAFATAAKIAGLALIPVIFVELVLHHKLNGKHVSFIKTFLVLNMPVLGFLYYLFINYQTFGDIFYFLRAQNSNWHTNFYPIIPALKQAFSFTHDPEVETRLYLGFSQAAAFFLGLITTLYSYFKLRKSYFVFSLAIFLIYSSMSYWLSFPRYLLSLFPLFIMLGKFSSYRLFFTAWSIVSIIFLFIFGTIALEHGPIL